ncbi:MAG: histidine kinase [Chloroflexota bacterium]|nr:MAG: histidine kinase [Chloroflexota bacterium]
MSRYDELRARFTGSPDERIALLEQMLREPLETATALAADLGALDPSRGAALFGGRFGELVEILAISAAKLGEVAKQLPALRERSRAVGGAREEDIHAFRHDLLTPLGTVRGVAGMLAQTDLSQAPDLPADFAAKVQELVRAMNELKDVLDALTDARVRQ